MYRYFFYRHAPENGEENFEHGWVNGRIGRLGYMPMESVGDIVIVWTNTKIAIGMISCSDLKHEWPSKVEYRDATVKWILRKPMKEVDFHERFGLWTRAKHGDEECKELQDKAKQVVARIVKCPKPGTKRPPQSTMSSFFTKMSKGSQNKTTTQTKDQVEC